MSWAVVAFPLGPGDRSSLCEWGRCSIRVALANREWQSLCETVYLLTIAVLWNPVGVQVCLVYHPRVALCGKAAQLTLGYGV